MSSNTDSLYQQKCSRIFCSPGVRRRNLYALMAELGILGTVSTNSASAVPYSLLHKILVPLTLRCSTIERSGAVGLLLQKAFSETLTNVRCTLHYHYAIERISVRSVIFHSKGYLRRELLQL